MPTCRPSRARTGNSLGSAKYPGLWSRGPVARELGRRAAGGRRGPERERSKRRGSADCRIRAIATRRRPRPSAPTRCPTLIRACAGVDAGGASDSRRQGPAATRGPTPPSARPLRAFHDCGQQLCGEHRSVFATDGPGILDTGRSSRGGGYWLVRPDGSNMAVCTGRSTNQSASDQCPYYSRYAMVSKSGRSQHRPDGRYCCGRGLSDRKTRSARRDHAGGGDAAGPLVGSRAATSTA
jgi:hypothetical protein